MSNAPVDVRYAGLGGDTPRRFGCGCGEWFEPLAWARAWEIPVPEWVEYDSEMRGWDYRIARTMSHDTTYALTQQLILRALEPLFLFSSYHKPRGYDSVSGYVVGPARIVGVTGMVDLACGRYPGVRQRIRIPVRVKYSTA